jgi:N-terminal acetyltransferase B complex catalytic subunit
MTTHRRFVASDLFRFNNINLDPLTETYSISSYFDYLSRWPDYFIISENSNKSLMGYVMGKAEGDDELWHGHVSAVTVAPEYRRMGLARHLMGLLEQVSEKIYDTFFVDLFVRQSNKIAIGMYEAFGYSIYRRVIGYYTGPEEDAYGKNELNC